MDPDYELSETVREEANKRREKEKAELVEKAKTKIHEDFQKEFHKREEQLIEIQNRITCLAKTLHVLRYVLVSSYYNKQEAQLQLSEEELKLVGNQQRLHPAVKRLTSERELSNIDFSQRKTRRTHKLNQVMSIDLEESKEGKNETIPSSQNSSVRPSDDCATIPRNRQMTNRRVIVGNISKWMPSDNPEDKSTHKWMVYVRGPPDNPKIDDIIKKIIFHLHPSYHPHDVIEINEHPFHLTRRGWGEFPMRCQLVFKSRLNKPVDVIHHLKLDKTYSGRQTLGSESVVELTLHDPNALASEENKSKSENSNNSKPLHVHAKSVLKPVVPSASSSSASVTGKDLNQKIAKQLLVNDFSHSVAVKKDILDPSYMDVENIDILETSLSEDSSNVTKEDIQGDFYYEQCPALTDHTYSRRTVSSY